MEERALLRQALLLDQPMVRRVVERALPVLLLLGPQDVRRALVAGEKILPVLAVEEFAERLDAPDDEQEIVLPRQREHRIDQIMPRAGVAEMDLEAVGEEGEEVIGDLGRRSSITASRIVQQAADSLPCSRSVKLRSTDGFA